jgi:hypothetical protein
MEFFFVFGMEIDEPRGAGSPLIPLLEKGRGIIKASPLLRRTMGSKYSSTCEEGRREQKNSSPWARRPLHKSGI